MRSEIEAYKIDPDVGEHLCCLHGTDLHHREPDSATHESVIRVDVCEYVS